MTIRSFVNLALELQLLPAQNVTALKKKVNIFISVFKYDDEEDADWYLIGKIMFVTYF